MAMDAIPKALAIVVFLISLLTNYIILTQTNNWVQGTQSGTTEWILLIIMIVNAFVSIILIPVIIALGGNANIFSIIKGIFWLYIALALVPVITIYLSDLSDQFVPEGTPKLIMALMLIVGTILIGLVYPILAVLDNGED